MKKIEELEKKVKALQAEIEELKNAEKDVDFFEYHNHLSDMDYLRANFADCAAELKLNICGSFEYKEDAMKAFKRFAAERVMQYEFDKINVDWVPDWVNSSLIKYYIAYNTEEKSFEVGCTRDIKDSNFYCRTVKDCNELIMKLTSYGDKKLTILDWYFGVEQ